MIKLLLFTLLCGPAFAKTEQEIGFGSLSYHLLGEAAVFTKLENKVSSDGRLIANKMLTFKSTTSSRVFYDSDAVFFGENSVGSPMAGYMGAVGFYLGKNVQLGAIYGAYIQDNTEFIKRGIINEYTFLSDSKVNIVPVLGIEINFKTYISRQYFIKINNVVTPAVSNHTISLGVEF